MGWSHAWTICRRRCTSLEALVLLYCNFFAALGLMLPRHPSWLLVRNEDLVLAPIVTWGRVLAAMGAKYSTEAISLCPSELMSNRTRGRKSIIGLLSLFGRRTV